MGVSCPLLPLTPFPLLIAIRNRSPSSSLSSSLSFFTDLYFLLQAADFLHLDPPPRGRFSQGMCWKSSVIQALLHAGCEGPMVYSGMGLLDIPDFWDNVGLLSEWVHLFSEAHDNGFYSGLNLYIWESVSAANIAGQSVVLYVAFSSSWIWLKVLLQTTFSVMCWIWPRTEFGSVPLLSNGCFITLLNLFTKYPV